MVVTKFNLRSKIQTGIGIPSERIDELFALFTQVDASTTRKYGGTGLGLAISQLLCQLCQLMGGRIWITSEEGQGSTFFFTMITDAESNHNSHQTNIDKMDMLIRGLSSLQNKSILIIDDNQTNQQILSHYTLRWGMDVYTFSALSDVKPWLASEKRADVVILNRRILIDQDGTSDIRQIQVNAKLPTNAHSVHPI